MSSRSRGRSERKAIADFLYHLMVYVFTGALLIIVDVRAGTADNAILGLDWAYWVLLFWGLGVTGHGISAFFDEAENGDDAPASPQPSETERV